MTRPWVLVFVVMFILFTSQFEWKQQFGNEIEASPVTARKEQFVSKRQDLVKEKVILSQEKNIHKLKQLVRSLQEQLTQCKSEKYAANGTVVSLSETENLNDLDKRAILED